MTRNAPRKGHAPFAAFPLLAVLLAGSGCMPLGSATAPALLERVADGDYDVGIRYPSRRMRYVMIVEDDEETLALTNRPANTLAMQGPGSDNPATPPGAPQGTPLGADRVLAPCTEATGNWYRHTPAGYVCVGESAPAKTGG